MFTPADMKAQDFHISVVADITCDINGSVPTTIRASTITQPFYGYNHKTDKEDVPFNKETICVMAVDNLPCELPRDASEDFGKDLMERVIPFLFSDDPDQVIERASICKDGRLMPHF